jgi:hypothetical protein
MHPGQGFSFAGVDGPDAGMGMGAAEDFAMQQPRQLNIGPEPGAASNLVQAVMANGPGAHHFELAWTLALSIG